MRRAPALATTALVLTALTTAPAAADTPTPAPDTPGRAQERNVLLVMDSSGSMAEPTGGGTSRIEAAKKALHRLVEVTPADTRMGLRVYGSHDRPEGSPESCRDSDLVVPLGDANRDQLDQAIDRYTPVGWTPIDHSLRQAGRDIAGAEGQRTIILVSDGEESCVPDPCPAAEELAGQGIDVVVNTIGLNVTGTARDQLRCIADKGNGKYYDASNAKELEDALTRAAKRTGQDYQTDGEPIEGSAAREDAPLLTPGTHQDTFTESGAKWYRVERDRADDTIWVGAAARPENSDAGSTDVMLELYEPDADNRCESNYSSTGGDLGALDLAAVATTTYDNCDPSPELFVRVEAGLKTDGELPVRLHVVDEAPATNAGELPEPAAEPRWQDMPITEATGAPVLGGSSFGTAPVLEPGNHPVTLVPGEVQLFAVDLDWGQRLQVQSVVADASQLGGQYWWLDVYSPFGTLATEDDAAPEDRYAPGGVATDNTDDQLVLDNGTYEVRYANREKTLTSYWYPSLPGRHYIALSSGRQEQAADLNTERAATLQVQVIGDAGTGAPEYAQAPTPTPAATTAPEPAPNGGAGTGGAQDDASATPWGLIGGLAGGAVVLAGIGGALVWLLRRGA